MNTTMNVSLTPTTASGALCSNSPVAAAVAVVSTEAEAVALAGVLRGKKASEISSSYVPELYGKEMFTTRVSSKGETEETRQSIVDARPLSIPANELSLASSGQLGTLPGIGSSQNPQQHVPLPTSCPSVELSGAIGSGPNSSLQVPSDASDVPAVVTSAVAANVASCYSLKKNISWKCTLCGYHVLAMDQDGAPISFTTSAFGNLVPLTCPRCKVHHTSWHASSPFNREGDHMNLPTTLSNRYFVLGSEEQSMCLKDRDGSGACGQFSAAAEGASLSVVNRSFHQRTAPVSLLATKLRGARGTAVVTSVQRRAFYCGLCSRRLLRVDAHGEVVDMDRDQDGNVLPITCPGCEENHSNWVLKPYAVHP